MKYRKKPLIVNAAQWTEEAVDRLTALNILEGMLDELEASADWRERVGVLDTTSDLKPRSLIVETLEGAVILKAGGYLIKGIEGELYPCEKEIFEKSYDPVS